MCCGAGCFGSGARASRSHRFAGLGWSAGFRDPAGEATHPTIAQQLGGSRFVALTGAHTLVDHGDSLSFKLPRTRGWTRSGINYVRVRLTPADLYDVEYGKLAGFDYVVVDTVAGVGAEQLRDSFTRRTGLLVSL